MEKYINKLKHILDSDKKTQNLLFGLVLIVILLLSVKYIFPDSKETLPTISSNTDMVIPQNTEKKIEDILSKISGISEVYVMVNYATSDKIIPVYDTKENVDEEKSSGKTSVTSVIEKNVAYQEGKQGKVPIVESTELAIPQGAIIVAKGSSIGNNSLKIKEAVSCITGIPLHKITVFEK